MSTENQDQSPVAPQGSHASPAVEQPAVEPPAVERPAVEHPGAAMSAAEQPGAAMPAAELAPRTQEQHPQSQQTQELQPQSQQTQELHPQQHRTAPYPQSYGVPEQTTPLPQQHTPSPQPTLSQQPQPQQHTPSSPQPQPTLPPQHTPSPQPTQPQPQYGQYAPGHSYARPAYSQQAPYGQQAPSRPAPYPQQYGPGYGPGGQPSPHPANPYHVGGVQAPAPGVPGGPGDPVDPPEPADDAQPAERKHRGWVPVTTAAALAALLASGGTAGLLLALDDDTTPASISAIGDPGRVDAAPVTESTVTNPDWQAVTAAVAQSVVSIQVSTAQGGGEGSGLILDDQGHILTNNHVVAGAQDDVVTVTLADGRLFRADIVGLDPTTDLAVVKLQEPPSGLRPVALGNSDEVRVGDPVLAVGNPLGLANTATTGIVSAVDRPVSASDGMQQSPVVTNAIQIDAAINPGNSGGPLFDASGRVIGITSSIATLSGGMLGSQAGSIGLGFAIPVNLAKNISDQLIEKGVAEHAFLGVSLRSTAVTADGVSRRGAEVGVVQPGSPAEGAGIRVGDVIVAIDDQPVGSAESLTAFVRERRAGDQVTLTLVRDGAAMKVEATLAVREETTQPTPENQAPENQTPENQDPENQDQAPQEGGQGSGDGQDEDGGSLWDRLFPNDR